MIKSASEFLNLAALRRDKTSVRGQEVHYRELSVADRAKMLQLSQESPATVPAWLVGTCLLAPDGKRLLSDEEAAKVAEQSPEVIDAIAKAILVLSGMKEDDIPKD